MTLDIEPDLAALFEEVQPLLADGKNEQALLSLMDTVEFPPEHVDAARSAPHWQGKVDAAHTMLREGHALAEYEFDASRFEALSVPVLLLAGGESPRWFTEGTGARDQARAHRRVGALVGAKHKAMGSAPDRFAEEVLAFVRDPS